MSVEQNYSWLDRLVHRLAFSSPAVQLTAADIERTLLGQRFRRLDVHRPIFLTSLPRSGTTLMLEVLARLPSVASHCYRDMPFVLSPLLWEALSRSFRTPAEPRERAHRDGMKIGYDSPEAFEEVLWRACWPEKFGRDGIALWADDEDAGEFRAMFVSHMQRIVAVRSGGASGQRRYLSKNNANIARIGFLRRLFPDAMFVIPFRGPVDHAGSLLRQHLRFAALHQQDAFARRYMEDIGHFEFGMLHRPVGFRGLDAVRLRHRRDTLEYWIAYWIAAFSHILGYTDTVTLVSYEALCKAGPDGLRVVTDRLGVGSEAGDTAATLLHAPRSHAGHHVADRELLEQAEAVHRRLLDGSVL